MSNRSKHLLHSLGQSRSFAKLSLEAKVLWPMLIAAADDQGRLDADPQVVKWGVCPNVNEIDTEAIQRLMQEMQQQGMILTYDEEGKQYAQLVKWWTYQAPSYARPSDFPAPFGWKDRVRIRKGDKWIVENWEGEGGFQAAKNDGPIPSTMATGIPADKEKQQKVT
jgi:hypothetical protein